MNMNIIRIKNVYKRRGFIHSIGFIIRGYMLHGTKENNIFNIW